MSATPYTAAELARIRSADVARRFAYSEVERLLATVDAAEARANRAERQLTSTVAQLRHAYAQMIRPGWRDESVEQLAKGLIAPEIRAIERALSAPVQAGETREQAIEACARVYQRVRKCESPGPDACPYCVRETVALLDGARVNSMEANGERAATLAEAANHPTLATGASKERK